MDIPMDEEEIKQKLSPEEYEVLREHGTEAPFSGKYVDTHEAGTYRCKVCGNVLFTSMQKFDSGTGWPSFTDPAVAENIGTRSDDSHGMHRTEVFCKHCGSHLGHLFNDGPADKGGKRYCINSVCLEFEKGGRSQMTEVAMFGGGCFWCTEAVFEMLKGVSKVEPGYAGGKMANPTYEQVSTGTTGHAEVIRIKYDPAQISYRDLMTVFFGSHDATQLNRQGNDIGPQYRSAVFPTTPAQSKEAHDFIAGLNASAKEGAPIVTTVEEGATFYPAEDYHKNYYERNSNQGYCQIIIAPKLEKVQEKYAQLLADPARSKG